jgi:hypothetical protein
MDPNRRSATIEVLDADEHVLGGSRYGSDVAGYRSMLNTTACIWPDRVWVIEATTASATTSRTGHYVVHSTFVSCGQQAPDAAFFQIQGHGPLQL